MIEKMSRFGVGPGIMRRFLAGVLIAWGLRRLFPGAFSLFGADAIVRPYAVAWTAIGVVFWLVSLVAMLKAYEADHLCTSGVFSVCRHPIYGSWAIFVFPGILLLLDTWLAFPFAVVMALLVRKHGAKEDEYLRQRFGESFEAYRRSVPAVLPIGFLTKSLHGGARRSRR